MTTVKVKYTITVIEEYTLEEFTVDTQGSIAKTPEELLEAVKKDISEGAVYTPEMIECADNVSTVVELVQ